MFTGIISTVGHIESTERKGDLRIVISCDYALDSLKIGESIAVNGVCLTVTGISQNTVGKTCFNADLSAETVSRSVSGQWKTGNSVNLERALRAGDTLDGHIVSGHVDGVATILEISTSGDSHILRIEAPQHLAHLIAEKGSVALDGISLTVNQVAGNRFWINIIPHTWQKTTLSQRKTGDGLNLEIDTVARYVARMLQK